MGNTTIPGTSEELLASGGGWTYHDRFAHVAGWHELTARRLRVLRTTGALLDELDPTFAFLRAELAQVGDDTLHADGGEVIGMVAGSTYGHYEEHAKELGLG